ncbi:MAG: SGNH/GDSL hydrolase family protein, partial [Pirellula sp.]
DLAKPSVSIVCCGENECWEGERGLKSFRDAYQRLVNDLKAKGSRVIVMLPRQRETTSLVEPERTAAYNLALRLYNEQAKQIANVENFPIVDLESFQLKDTLTLDGVYWSESGYKAVSMEICKQLGVTSLPSPDTLTELRNTINAKNAWFFHRYRPQNETYLFLFRKHEQGNNAVELEQIDPQIATLETQIASMAK